MIAGGRADQAALALMVGQLGDKVHAAADLERADRLVVLMLDVDLRADEIVQRRVAEQRRNPQVRSNPPTRREHVGEGRHRPVAHR